MTPTSEMRAAAEKARYTLHDQKDDAIHHRYSIFEGEDIVLLFNTVGPFTARAVVDAFNAADEVEALRARVEELERGLSESQTWAETFNTARNELIKHKQVLRARAETAEASRDALAAQVERLLAFAGKAGGTALGIAISGSRHPNPDQVLLDLSRESMELSASARALTPAAEKVDG